jgi:hypothetical protein
MVTKKEFFSYMSAMYNEDYQDEDLYKAFKTIVKLDNKSQVKELKDIITMNKRERLLYRYSLAANGKELTPLQVDQYISMIELALENLEY